MRAIGICLGASSLSSALVRGGPHPAVLEGGNVWHEGNPRQALVSLLEEYRGKYDTIGITGRKFKDLVNLPCTSEPEAAEYAYRHLSRDYPAVDTIASAGGETFIVYQLDSGGKILNVFTGNKCASGTGEFFLQQVKRMGLAVDEAVRLADQANPYKVAVRCSVFCKSDCTHALNKGETKGRVVAGLCRMMSTKIVELVKQCGGQRVLLVGGTSANQVMVSFLRQELSQVIVPAEAAYFEALGAALWAIDHRPARPDGSLFKENHSSFSFLPPISAASSKVVFKAGEAGTSLGGEQCIVGLDVGSTTTKAVVIRSSDRAVLARVYQRTGGDPVGAARSCYRELAQQLLSGVKIIGLGVTGSGRQIAGLHAMTKGIINEIIAHASAAVYFDPEVDTIFEIGGQDAKYTYIVNGVASDYAMNEACSAGTGSFLEEAAKDALDLEVEDIASHALQSGNPPNFNDQCAAFISSDIKSAIQEDIPAQDIVAGLVYSICMNYANRVKGSRPVGRKVFMQGGVCYNRAVPMAMAALTGREIVVPPDPGLMGAFGVALQVKEKLERGLMEAGVFNLQELADRDMRQARSFTCTGGKEQCDRKCEIKLFQVQGRNYPFGGACNKYANLPGDFKGDVNRLDLAAFREKLVFGKYAPGGQPGGGGLRVGLSRGLLANTYYPLYSHFFHQLGCQVVTAGNPEAQGIEKKGAAFCYPVELAHGFLQDLLAQKPEVIFLPHVRGLHVPNGTDVSVTCPFVQAEPYYLKAAFPELRGIRLTSPVLDFSRGREALERQFTALGRNLGFGGKAAAMAFSKAMDIQEAFFCEIKEVGQKILQELEKQPERQAVVLFGRPYNAFASAGNMSIPRKLASRGYQVIPFDFLPVETEEPVAQMYWGLGQAILKASAFVARHPQLFGAFITSFSCGPDSFLISYFRERMAGKPSLTLELDHHTSDAGIDTRLEAFLDIVKGHAREPAKESGPAVPAFKPARTAYQNRQFWIEDSRGGRHRITDHGIRVLVPSMGDFAARCLVAALRHFNVDAVALPPSGEAELQAGKIYTTCKECLPLMLTVGSLQTYLERRPDPSETIVYFMPKTSGPCRFGQYKVLIEGIIRRQRWENVSVMSLSSANSYAGLPLKFQQRAWYAVVISDVMEEIRSAVLALSCDREKALPVYLEAEKVLLHALENADWPGLKAALPAAARLLAGIPLSQNLSQARKVLLTGEIYVRKDGFSRQFLVEKLAQKGIVVKTAPVSEWLYYCDYLLRRDLVQENPWKDKMRTYVKEKWKQRAEGEIKRVLARSNLCKSHRVDVEAILARAKGLISPYLTGEAILTIGSGLAEIIDRVDGVIAIGPFGCMPNRIAESILTKVMNQASSPQVMPFLAVETDGNLFPQLIEAKIEAFCLQVDRLNREKNISFLSI